LDGYDFDTGTENFILESCRHCRLIRTSPVLNNHELSRYYDTEYYGSSNGKFNSLVERWTIWSNNRLANSILRTVNTFKENKEKLKVLDIGCGRANLLNAFARNGCMCFGVERSDFPGDNSTNSITVFKENFIDIKIEKASFDVVILWHVLEHLANPKEVLAKAQSILKPHGQLVIAVPNYGSLQRKLFGKHWFHLDLPRHLFHFNNDSLRSMISASGFSIKKTACSCIDQQIFGFIQSTLNFIHPDKPNILYSILKRTSQKIGKFRIFIHLLLAGIILPIAILDFFLATITGQGACIVIYAQNEFTDK
jgi:SAM-dependent methyltransferase